MNINDIIKSGANTLLVVDALMLKEAFLSFVEEAKAEAREEAAQKAKYVNEVLSFKETAEMLGVSSPTLWRWNRDGYLTHYKVGGKNVYRLADVKRIKEGGEV